MTPPTLFDAAALDAAAAGVLRKVQPGRRGVFIVGGSTTGARVELGARWGTRAEAAGWAEKTWGGPGWAAGARVQVNF